LAEGSHEGIHEIRSGDAVPELQGNRGGGGILSLLSSSPHPCGDDREIQPPLPPRRLLLPRGATAALVAAFLAGAAPLLVQKPTRSFEFGFTAPDQTPEEAEAGIKIHSRGILRLRQLVESQAWRELQLALQESSSLLKQDLYTIIQTKPEGQRPLLRKLYSTLFNNVTRIRSGFKIGRDRGNEFKTDALYIMQANPVYHGARQS
ncbi:hypothetical protein Taro_005134, partial [Colocasia esculenta]|nr:hypothetical protein [Colocasia esculenta]